MNYPEAHLSAAQAVQRAWQEKDLQLLQSKLAEKVEWYENPTQSPLLSKDAVIQQWKKDLTDQTNIEVKVRLLDHVEERGYFRCSATWQTKQVVNKFDGIFIMHLNRQGEITYFNQWGVM